MIARPKSILAARFTRTPRAMSLVDRVLRMVSLHRERHALGSLDAHLLRDIGVTRQDAKAEANRPVWDAPGRWLR